MRAFIAMLEPDVSLSYETHHGEVKLATLLKQGDVGKAETGCDLIAMEPRGDDEAAEAGRDSRLDGIRDDVAQTADGRSDFVQDRHCHAGSTGVDIRMG